MRYKIISENNRFKVVDSMFHNTLLCHTGSMERAQEIVDDYNQNHTDAPEPTALIEFAARRNQELVGGEKSFERSMSPQDAVVLRRSTRGESLRTDEAA